VIVTNQKDYGALVDRKIDQFVKNDFILESLRILELFGYGLFYRPFLFWFVFRLPQIFWNLQGKRFKALMEYFSIDFPVHKVSRIRRSIGHVNFYRLEEEIKEQRQKANYYIEGLKNLEGIKVIHESDYGKATHPYLTLIFDDSEKRERALKQFENSGLGVS